MKSVRGNGPVVKGGIRVFFTESGSSDAEGNHLSMQNTWKPFTGAAQLPL